MRPLPWLRLYQSAVNHPKILRLSEQDRWRWLALLALAANQNGKLPCTEDLAAWLRLSHAKASATVDRLLLVGLLESAQAVLCVHDWQDWQFPSDYSTTRVRRYRQKQVRPFHATFHGNGSETGHGNGNETGPSEQTISEQTIAHSEEPVVEFGKPNIDCTAALNGKPKTISPDLVRWAFEIYCKATGKTSRYALSDKRARIISRRLEESRRYLFGPLSESRNEQIPETVEGQRAWLKDLWEIAVKNLAADTWWMGRAESYREGGDPKTLSNLERAFGTWERFEKFVTTSDNECGALPAGRAGSGVSEEAIKIYERRRQRDLNDVT